ncbi:MAG: hypothetical protein DRP66_06015 [Planctomycetota bacterium]|nr:MAG: hypothetical protein DRP66_06015 [Planctomycetota bacterium]
MGGTKLTDKQKMEIALDMLGDKMSQAGIRSKWGISSTDACKVRDQALEMFLKEMERSSKDLNNLRAGVADIKKLVRDHSLVVSYLKKKMKF